jgi:protein TonB
MREGDLIYQGKPQYPSLARSARIQGPVVLEAVISQQGTIAKGPYGPSPLVRAALDAVMQWRDRCYVLNNDPVEVETQISGELSLSGG